MAKETGAISMFYTCARCGQSNPISNQTCFFCKNSAPQNALDRSKTNAQPLPAPAPYLHWQDQLRSKWVSLFLCLVLGGLGFHKFYEGDKLLGMLYILTFGLFGIGIAVDLIALIFKSNSYYPGITAVERGKFSKS